ncbi:T9SS type A sorting domain-containing protein [Flavobacterium sp. HXWNR69]|uniref:T9SS type A sorting domain-containing protein n=1 Tax=Flavobacterium fragile TaxID=2949085 RepID=A0ABT0TIL0_9FLAO|nr:T9SS type A sorting domain-containing protein [Flavobacterium sp. HXWNR69]MCL9770812.1 T9SS type A sorting domain-containing protein [Flavobacterium sp. HXWNR69]
MKKITIVFLLSFIKLFSQTPTVQWAGRIGGNYFDSAQGLSVDQSGNLYITGGYQSNIDLDIGAGNYPITGTSGSDAFLAKYNNNGNILWGVKFSGTLDSSGYNIGTDANGNVYSVGKFFNTIDFNPGAGIFNLTATPGPYSISDIYLSKLDSNGNFVYAKKIGGLGVKDPSGFKVDSNGDIYLSGYFNKETFFSDTVSLIPTVGQDNIYDMFIAKWNSNGNLLWAKQIGSGSIMQRSESMITDSNGNIYLCGNFHETTDFDPSTSGTFFMTPHTLGSTDIFVLKLDNDGNFVWAKNMGGSAPNSAKSIALDQSNNLTITGYFSGTIDFDPGINNYFLTCPPNSGYNPFLLKLNSNGDFIWAKHLIGNGYGSSVTINPNGNICITGKFNNTCDFSSGNSTAINSTLGGSDIFIAEYTNSGNFNWVKCIGSNQDDIGNSVVADSFGNYFNIGDFYGNAYINNSLDTLNLTSQGYQDIMFIKISSSNLSTDDFNRDDFSLYPNPSKNELYLTVPKAYENSVLAVYSINGQLLINSELKNNLNIDDLATGTYIIKITNDKNQSIERKFIKN